MEVRRIEPRDLDAFMLTAEAFYAESRNAKLPVDLDKFRSIVDLAMQPQHEELVAVLIAIDDNDKVAGYSILNTFCDYTKVPLGDLYQFYVAKEYRGKGVSHALRDASVAQFKAWGCPLSHISADTGIDETGVTTALFENLWKQAGYQRTGIIMTLEH